MAKKSMTDSDKFLEGCLWVVAIFVSIAFVVGFALSLFYFIGSVFDGNWTSCIHVLVLWVVCGGLVNVVIGENK